MLKNRIILLLMWIFASKKGYCGKLERVAIFPANVLEDYHEYRQISIIHFSVPKCSAAVEFKFKVKEEKTGGIGSCSARNVSIHLKSGTIPLVNPDNSRVKANLISGRRKYYNATMMSDGEEKSIRINAPPSGDWYAIAFRSWTNPKDDKIKQQGLGPSCDTVLDAELFIESTDRAAFLEYESQDFILNKTSDTFAVQIIRQMNNVKQNLFLEPHCGENCSIAVHVIAQDHLNSTIINSSSNYTLSFIPRANEHHYIIFRLISGEESKISVMLLNEKPNDVNSEEIMILTRKSSPEIFTTDYEYFIGNETKPAPFNLTANNLTVLVFDVHRVYDVGGTIMLGLKLADNDKDKKKEDEKKNIVVVGCASLGYYSNITMGGGCRRASNTTLPDIYVNNTGPAYIHIPYPEPGTWYLSLKAFHVDEKCSCAEKCFNTTVCDDCKCMNSTSYTVETIVSSYPCVEGRCGSWGNCVQYPNGGLTFAACHCYGGYIGFDCADDTFVLVRSDIIIQLLLLTLSNIAFIGSIYIAIRREYFTEAIVYGAVMFFSTFYHVCEAGENIISVCIMRLSVLQFCDFFNALLSIWVTLVAMASFGPRLTAFCQIAGAIIIAMGAEMDRTALWVFLVPAITGSALIGLSWASRCRRKRTFLYPSRPYRTIHLPAGLLLVSVGLICYAFLQTRSNYYIVHSFWHVCVAISVILLLPKRHYMK